MKGDFTRFTWTPEKNYSSVRMQQGRVQVDADWNEQADIVEHLRETGVGDLVGARGVPMQGGGFEVSVVGSDDDLGLSAGRIYVDGIHCVAPAGLTYRNQRDFPEAPLPSQMDPPPDPLAGRYLVYLDVWRRHVTAVEDPSIRERALGGPDTATREQTVCQVKLFPAGPDEGRPDCLANPPGWGDLTAPSSGRLRARTRPGVASSDPCIVPAQAGYTRLENQLYRVEVHEGGTLGDATFKWSRDNGSVVTAWLGQTSAKPEELQVASTGNDKVLGFHDAHWVELTDDTRELHGRPGLILRVVRVEGDVIEIDPQGRTIDRDDFPRNPKIRRWDLPATADGAPPVTAPTSNQGYLELENGIEVRFEQGTYRTGDFWVIPARAFVGEFAGEIEWPQESAEQGEARLSLGIEHHYCKLGLVVFEGEEFDSEATDCRPFFPAVTELTRFFKIGGEGQEALPGAALPCTLQVAVTNGEYPVHGARVQFRIPEDAGSLLSGTLPRGPQLVVSTRADGRAECGWQLPAPPPGDGNPACLRAEAVLLDDSLAAPAPVLTFSARLSQASQVGYDPSACPPLLEAGVSTLQQAVDELCRHLGGAEPGIGIVGVRTARENERVEHEGSLPVDRLAGGLVIEFDREIAPEAILGERFSRPAPSRPNCTVTFDMPYPLTFEERSFWGDGRSGVVGFQPLVLAANLSVQDRFVVWRPDSRAEEWLDEELFQRLLDPDINITDRILVHLRLRGNYLWQEGGGDDPQVYVDGDVFGRPGSDGRMALRLPSGDGRRGGDFEIWFWVVPEAEEGGLVLTAAVSGSTVTGSLRDPSGAPVPGVAVTLTDLASGQGRTAQTTTNGSYRFRDVPNGRYRVAATSGGLSTTRTVVVGGIIAPPLQPVQPIRPVITEVPGIGTVLGRRLEAAGIHTAEALAATEVPRLAEILRVPPTRAEALRKAAKDFLG